MSEVESAAAAARDGAAPSGRVAADDAEFTSTVRSVGFGVSAFATIIFVGISQGVHWITSNDTLTSRTVWDVSGPLLVPYAVVWLLIFVAAAAAFTAPIAYRRMLAAIGKAALAFEALLAVAIVQRGLSAEANPQTMGLGAGILTLLLALIAAAVALGFAGTKS